MNGYQLRIRVYISDFSYTMAWCQYIVHVMLLIASLEDTIYVHILGAHRDSAFFLTAFLL